MAQFVMCAALSWLAVSLLFLANPSRRNKDGTFKTLPPWIKILNILVAAASLLLIISIVVFGLYSIIYLPVATIKNNLQQWWDDFTEIWFAQCLLGLAFGSILAVWLRRVYQAKPDAELTLAQKIEGFALIILFIVGTTSTPVVELLRGATIDAGFVNLKLAGAAVGELEESKTSSNNIAPSLSMKFGGGQSASGNQNSPQRTDEEIGIKTVSEIHLYMNLDAQRIAGVWNADGRVPPTVGAASRPAENGAAAIALDLESASLKYEHNITQFTKCLRFLVAKTDDEEYARSLLIGLKPRLSELYYLSLAKLSSAEKAEGTVIDTNIAATAKGLATALSEAMLNAKEHAARIAPLGGDPQAKSCNFAVTPYSDSELKEILAERRPYLAMLYAATLQLGHQELTAIAILDDWLKALQQSNQPDYLRVVEPWFKLRVYATQYLLFESLFRRNPSQSQQTLESHLEHMRLFVDAFRDRPPIRFFYEKIFVNSNIDLVEDEFETEPNYSAECPKGYEDDDVSLSLGLLTAKAVFARRMIQHPDFATKYLPMAASYAEHIANADYGCLGNRFPAEFVARTKGENFRVFALETLARIAARKAVGTGYQGWVVKELRLAEAALKFALTTIAGHDGTEIKELRDELEVLVRNVDAEITRRDR